MMNAMLNLPFNPLERARLIEAIVTKQGMRKYHRFRPAPYYGGIATADAVGCCFLCAYCWSYFRILKSEDIGRFYSSLEVAKRLISLVQKKHYRYARITGCEPILGEPSLEHLVKVIQTINQRLPQVSFILETNGFILGYYPQLVKQLKPFKNLSIRVAIKGWDPLSFEQISGAKQEFFDYPLEGVRLMLAQGCDAWIAVMEDVFGRDGMRKLKRYLKEKQIKAEIETETLERYPYVMENIGKRNVRLVS